METPMDTMDSLTGLVVPGDEADHDDLAAAARRWRIEQHDRRVRATRIARVLQRAAEACGGYASSRLRVRLPGQPERRPAAAVVAADIPVDGIATEPPLLVVELAPATAAPWLDCGVKVVWVIAGDGVADGQLEEHTRNGVRVRKPGRHVTVPAPARTRLAVADLLA